MPENLGFLGNVWVLVFTIIGVLSGIVWVVREGVMIYYPEQANRRYAFWAFVRIAFVIAVVMMWLNEHSKVTQLIKLYQETTMPKLEGEIYQTITGQIAGTLKDGTQRLGPTGVLLVVSIRNRGADSIAEGYKLQVFDPNSNLIGNGSLQLIPPRFSLGDINLTNEALLVNKTEEIPIPKGGSRKGYLFFIVKDVDVGQLQNLGTKFVISFQDIAGKPYSAQAVVTHNTITTEPFWFPGTPFPKDMKAK
jgi:hypothetical protein